MGLKPSFRVVANGADITAVLANFLLSIKVTDKTGYESDLCEIILADDPKQPITFPPKGAVLEVYMGYDADLIKMGVFIVDEIELEGPPERMTIRARASIQTESKDGKTSIMSQKTRSWAKETTIDDVVKKIANEHGLASKVSDSLKAVKLPHLDQSDESDINFLLRVAKRYDVICKAAGGKLLFLKRGESSLSSVSLSRGDLSSWRMTQSSKDSAGTVVAYWNERKNAKRHEVQVGEGEPVRRLKHSYADAKSAQVAAQSALDTAKRGEETLSLTLPGNPLLSAEMPLEISEVREGINGNWIIEQVTHTIDKSLGYSCGVEGVKVVE
ncbi:contractile injection system protein, VgrG/Pvc8 family [Acinetobacter sp. PK01]|uniref:phage late control D family protein n=1 Tax=Acinetobacter sp. PK01 TaxID=2930198 RepID=UPI001FB817CD|nr:contractile injection system protein, VgrG/Pvc8 family [Acinetobacter sp. PK01]UOG18732.1 hypothetical protein MP622_03710 [Acinetobacter sp. PK01]